MKTGSQIRDAMAVLTAAQHSACDCPVQGDPVHSEQCRLGGLMVDAVLDALRWVVDDKSDFDGMIEGLQIIQAGGDPDGTYIPDSASRQKLGSE